MHHCPAASNKGAATAGLDRVRSKMRDRFSVTFGYNGCQVYDGGDLAGEALSIGSLVLKIIRE